MKHSTPSPTPRLIPRREFRTLLTHFTVWMLLALVTLSSNLSAQAPPTVSMMPSYNQNPTYANAAINEPIQVWGRVTGGSGTYTNYTLDFGDGTTESINSGPQPGPASINSITFEMLDTCSLGTYTFYLNGVALGSTGSNPANSCTCTPPLTSFTVNNPALLANWLPSSTANALRIDVAGGQYVAWARATIVSGASSKTAYIINGGNGPAVNGSDLCTSGYRTLNGQSFTNNNLYAPTVGGGFAIPDGPDFIKKDHVYTTSGSKTVTLTVTDSAGQTSSRSAVIRVLLNPTHDERVNMAIEKGLIYLYRTQQRTTTAGIPVSYWYAQTGEIGNGATGASLQSFGENGHLANNDPVADIYAETVQRGVYHLVTRGRQMAISATVAGQNPDSNGNGRGIYEDSAQAYSHSFVMMGIINAYPSGAAAQAAAIPAALWTGGGAVPANFYEFIQDMLDQYSYSQSEATGGWHYSMNTSDSGGYDGSTHQWPNISILSAKERWGINPPAWVVSRSMTCYQQLTDHTGSVYDGGLGYSSSTSWRNCSKTGGALVGYYLGGKLVGPDADANLSMKFIKRYWGGYTSYGADGHGWLSDFYAMFALKKGLQLQGVTTIETTPNGVSDGVSHNWYNEMSGWLLGNASLLPASYVGPGRTLANAFGQQADGSWVSPNSYVGSYGAPLCTPHAILVLTKAVTIPLPVAVVAAVPDQSSRFPAAFALDGSGSYHQSTNSNIVEYLWDLDASNGLDWNNPDATGRITSANPGWSTPGNRTITLRVKDDATTPNYATATTVVRVVDTDVAPVAVPIPASQLPAVYTGPVGGTILLDGSESFDPEGDPITGYAWDLDGNGTFGDAADAAKDTSGNGATGVTASLVFTAEYNGQIGLRVTSTPPNGLPKSSNNTTTIDVQAATSDLFVASINASNVVIGSSADVQVVVESFSGSGKDANSVVVRFYDGNPLTTGNVIGSAVTVSIPKGTSQVVNVTGLPLSPGQETVWAYVDASAIFSEFDENNNTANVNVSNKPPVAVAQNATVSAGADCSAAASINDGSSDPDAGDSITLAQVPAGPYPIGTTEVTLTVTDSHGATNSATAQVAVIDDTRPVINGCPENIVVQTGPGRETCDQVATWTAPTTTDCSAVTLQATHASGDTFPVGTTTVTYSATDAFNNTSTCSFTVKVEDTTPPAAPVLADVTGECSASIANAPTITDGCAGTITGTTSDSLSRDTQGTSVVTWSFNDGNGNVVTATQNIIVKDTAAPAIPVLADVTGECSAAITDIPTTTDGCAGTITGTTNDSLTRDTQGSSVVTWSFDDGHGNVVTATQNIIVRDTEAPAAPVLADVTGECSATITDIPTASDGCAGTITGTTSDSLTRDTQGTSVVTWSFDDGHGNVVTATQNIIVKDTEAPTIPVLADVTGQCSATITDIPTASDGCAGTITGTTSDSLTRDTQGTSVVTWSFDDGHGNVVTATQNIVVKDTEAPAIPVLADVTGQCSATIPAAPTTTDNCAGTITGTTSDPLTRDTQGTSVVTWSFDDGHGNVVTTTQNIIVKDTEAPAIPVLADVNGQCSATIPAAPTTTDNCAGTITGTTSDSLTRDTQGTSVVTWSFDDGHGNVVTATQNIIVKDTEAPVITCPPAASVAFGAVPAAATTSAQFIAQGGTITENCTANPAVTSSDVVAGLCPTVVTRTYTVTDAVGLAATCVQTITVNNLFAGDGILWHQPLARNGASDDTDPGAGGTLKYRFKAGSSIPIQIHATGCNSQVTGNSNVTGKVVVFGDTDMDGVVDAGELPLNIAYNGVGGPGGVMDKIGGFLKYNLNTKVLPVTLKCYILQVTVTDTSTGESRVETVPLQAK